MKEEIALEKALACSALQFLGNWREPRSDYPKTASDLEKIIPAFIVKGAERHIGAVTSCIPDMGYLL